MMSRGVEMTTARLAVLSVLALISAAFAAVSDDYPSPPVRLLVGFPPRASAHITARVGGDRMSRPPGQQFVIENRPRAPAPPAARAAAPAPPGGHTLLLGSP